MTWLVTGGAGYIGSHVVRAFQAEGIDSVVLDDLSTGLREFVPVGVPFIEGTILDTPLVTRALTEHAVTGVVHLAGFKYAGESVKRPIHTWEQNGNGTLSMLRAVTEAQVPNFVLSSSAAVYGTPDVDLVTETTATRPQSPYGESKLVDEWMLADVARATGLSHTSLRYFNVVGSGSPELWDSSPHNLFPLVISALRDGRVPIIFGQDYPTPDGTCVRDYVHVADLAHSHVAAAKALEAGTALQPVYNLGSGLGVSVAQIMAAMARVTGIDFTPAIAPRRPGDPARIVADGSAAERDLDWQMRHDLDRMVSDAWSAGGAA
ncbi:MAG: UDP-glucose 4-epimerase GalE [Micropruina sp.]